MLKISKKGDYGLLLMTALAKLGRKEWGSLSSIAEENNLPEKFLEQIAGKLKMTGLIESREGVGGGYKLARKATKISVAEVLEALEGKVLPVMCMKGWCGREKVCGHRKVAIKMAEAIERALKGVTVADLINK